eukprot:CCRYP_019953-RA/>CCRYP_019953-RA protein AED:0.46 eAED:1.00 QI:0/-1/0/1/-1/0/1/0/76
MLSAKVSMSLKQYPTFHGQELSVTINLTHESKPSSTSEINMVIALSPNPHLMASALLSTDFVLSSINALLLDNKQS